MRNSLRKKLDAFTPHPEDLNNIEVILEKRGFDDEEFPEILERHMLYIKKKLFRGAHPFDVGELVTIRENMGEVQL